MPPKAMTATTPPGVMPEAEREWHRIKAEFCLATGVRPDEYDRMSLAEIEIWRTAYVELNKQK